MEIPNCITIVSFLSVFHLLGVNGIEVLHSYLVGSILTEYTPFGYMTCARYCKNMPVCSAFNYLKMELKCELNWGTESTHTLSSLAGSTYVRMENTTQVYLSTCDQLQCSIKETCHALSDENETPLCAIERCDVPLTIGGVNYSGQYPLVGTIIETNCILPSTYVSDPNTAYHVIGKQFFGCDPNGNWVLINETCGVMEYTIYTDYSVFTTVRSRCQAMGKDLAIVDTAGKDNVISAALAQRGADPNPYYFFGMDDKATEGTFKHLDGSDVVYSNWDGGASQPDDCCGGQDCVCYWRAVLKWHDIQCAFQCNYICERFIPL